ncbi:metalloprotease, partial [Candidatus Woesearchaeota archaeon CG10_big_fil_rev_8_21_14_0_10_30_7]
MKFSHKEIFDLVKAWVIISFAFAIVFKNAGDVFINIVLMSLITVGAGFLLHELAHKFVAQH